MTIVVNLTRTCEVCPSQWEGRTADGGHIYVRYRWGWLHIGLGTTLNGAIDDMTIDRQMGDEYDGQLTYAQLIAATQDDSIRWPTKDG